MVGWELLKTLWAAVSWACAEAATNFRGLNCPVIPTGILYKLLDKEGTTRGGKCERWWLWEIWAGTMRALISPAIKLSGNKRRNGSINFKLIIETVEIIKKMDASCDSVSRPLNWCIILGLIG